LKKLLGVARILKLFKLNTNEGKKMVSYCLRITGDFKADGLVEIKYKL